MQNFLLGEYIRQRRLDLGLTQAEVCSGICEPITLSRLEMANRHLAGIGLMQFCSVWDYQTTAIMHCYLPMN